MHQTIVDRTLPPTNDTNTNTPMNYPKPYPTSSDCSKDYDKEGSENLFDVHIYHPSKHKYISLLTESLKNTNILPIFGKRVQCLVVQKSHTDPHSSSSPLTIMGRFYPYDPNRGMEYAGTILRVEDLPNNQSSETGLNIWDGALLL